MSVWAWVAISLATVFWTALIALAWAVHPVFDPQLRLAHRLCSYWGRTLMTVAPGCRVRVYGLERIPAGKPVIFMANHQSHVDVPALFCIPAQFKWMAAVPLFRIPVFGWAMRMAGYIPVDRGNRRAGIQSMEAAKRWLLRGMSIFVFPEGTRSRTGVFGRFQMGGFRLAALSRTPVVPVVVVGTRQLLPRDQWVFDWGVEVEIHILEPIMFPEEMNRARVEAWALHARMWEFFGDRVSIKSKERKNG